MLTRRRFLQAASAASAGLFLPWRAAVGSPGLVKWSEPLPVPPVWTTGDLARRGLTIAPATHVFHHQLGPTPTWGYGGLPYLGPTIEAERGEPVTFLARNRLGSHLLGVDERLHGASTGDQVAPRVSLHLHEGYTAPQSDGHPEDTFLPGEDHLYSYPHDQQAGSAWYHDHALGITRLNVYAGLAGFYPIRDHDAEKHLPTGEFEVPLVLQDKAFERLGDSSRLVYPDPWAPEFFGDVAVVNGKAWPNLDVRRAAYRLRLLNGSSSRIYHLRLSPALPFHLIGTEAGVLPAPRPLQSLVLAPGERADVVVDFRGRSSGDRLRLLNVALPPQVVSPADVELPQLLQFTVMRAAGPSRRLPSSFPAHGVPDLRRVVRRRSLLLVEIIDPATLQPAMALLNNRRFDTEELEEPVVHTLEQWDLINLSADTHPIHLHLVQFRLLDRQPIATANYLRDVFGTEELHPQDVGRGVRPFPSADGYATGPSSAAAPYEDGWKDTIQAHPGMITRIVVPFGYGAAPGVPFGQSTTFTGEYVWHCHILDHEDNEMMLPYRVVGG